MDFLGLHLAFYDVKSKAKDNVMGNFVACNNINVVGPEVHHGHHTGQLVKNIALTKIARICNQVASRIKGTAHSRKCLERGLFQ